MKDRKSGKPFADAKEFAAHHQGGRTLLEHYTGFTNYSVVSPPQDDGQNLVLFSPGPKQFPSLHERQEILTKVMLNIGLQVVLESYLAEHKNYETIQQAGLLKPGTQWKDVVAALDAAMKEKNAALSMTVTDKLNKAVSKLGVKRTSEVLKAGRFIATSSDLLAQIPPGDAVPYEPIDPQHSVSNTNPVLESFYVRSARYNFAWDEHKRQRIAYNRQYAEWMAQHHSDPKHAPPLPEAPKPPYEQNPELRERPVDPRIERFEALFGKYLSFYETGAKQWESAASKLMEQIDPPMWAAAVIDASTLRDANRITIIPRSFNRVDRVLELLSKHVNTLLEPPKLSPGGHFDQKAYFDIRESRGGVLSPQKGPVAEIKIEEENIHKAYKRSHAIYKCMQRLDKYMTGALRPSEHAEKILEDYQALHERYGKQDRFYAPAECTPEQFAKPEGPAFCYRELKRLHQSIYVVALTKAPEAWQRKYITEALAFNGKLLQNKLDREGFPEELLAEINPELFARTKTEFDKAKRAEKQAPVRE